MSISGAPFKIAEQSKDCYRITINGQLLSADAVELRKEINALKIIDAEIIYLDTASVSHADLTGINEIINAHHHLQSLSKTLILLYKKNSVIEKWIETTRLDRFISTAIVPAS